MGAFVRLFPRVFRGRHVHHPAVEIRRGARVVLDGSLGAVTSRLDRLANVTLGRTNLPVGDKVYSLNSFRAGPPRGFGDRLRIPIEFATEVPVNDNTSDPTLVWDPAIAPCQ